MSVQQGPSTVSPGQGLSIVSPEQAVGQIDDLTKQILLKEIELERFNLHYVLEVAKQGRWKGWRYAFFQEANTGLNLAGGIISSVNRGENLHHSQGVKLHPQEAANYIPMIGSIIGASAAAGEFTINGYHDWIARRHGFSPAASIKRVSELKNEISKLIDRRAELIRIEASRPELAQYVLVDNAEEKILKDILGETLKEFARYHVGARKLIAFQQMQYLIDAGKYTTGAIGSDFAYLSLARRKRIWNGRAGVLFAVSSQLTLWGPIASRLYAKAVGAITSRRVGKIMRDQADAEIATLQADLSALDKIIKDDATTEAAVGQATERQAMFETHERTFSREISMQAKKEAAAKLTATQNIAAGAFVGGAKTACAVLFMVPGFNRNYNSKTARAGRVTNDLLFTSAVVGLPANTFSMVDTLRIQVKGEIARHRAAKAGTLPTQIAAARLKELDNIEQRLTAAHN
ncbi:MAG TPA: hypothetical protein V6D17_02995 [Candidatus Obscuribacterales bacterium]